jgi:predicted amino acid dehydrogenase
MPSILDSITQQVTYSTVQQVSQRLGVDPAIAQQTVNAAIPVITAAIAAHARSGGAETIHREATSHAANPQQQTSLPQVLGDQSANVEQRVGEAAGISREDAGTILSTIAPAVLRGIGEHVQQQGIDPGQLANVLSGISGGQRQVGRPSTASGEATM